MQIKTVGDTIIIGLKEVKGNLKWFVVKSKWKKRDLKFSTRNRTCILTENLQWQKSYETLQGCLY